MKQVKETKAMRMQLNKENIFNFETCIDLDESLWLKLNSEFKNEIEFQTFRLHVDKPSTTVFECVCLQVGTP